MSDRLPIDVNDRVEWALAWGVWTVEEIYEGTDQCRIVMRQTARLSDLTRYPFKERS